MHYPQLPSDEIEGVDLVALDGRAGACLEEYFIRGGRGARLNGDLRKALEECAAELDGVRGTLRGDAARYFGRLQQLIDLVLSEPTDQRRGFT
jgi:hypothetical protein